MNILVTGGAGYIGSVCVEELTKLNHRIVVIDNLQEGHRAAVLPKATFYLGDYGDRNLLEKIFKNHHIETVIHFAGETTIKYSMSDPSIYFKNNVIKGILLLDTMRKYGCDQFIFSSTAALFGEAEYVPIDEEHSMIPINAYGESKLIFERILEWYHSAYGLKFNSFRYFNVAGATDNLGEDHKNESHLIPIIIQTAMGKRNKVFIFGNDYPTKDRTCVRDYIHVIDLTKAHIQALDNLNSHPNAKYNLGNGKGFSNLEVLKMVENVSGIKVNFEFGPRRKGDPPVLIASSKLAEKELGWEPEHNLLEEVVQSAYNWHLNHPNGYRKMEKN